MNYTEKYHLPQWEETDRVMRTDFNQMCARIENGLAQGQTRDDALSGRIESAQAAAESARQTALDYRHFVLGYYMGMGVEQEITVGFRPIALLIGRSGSQWQGFFPEKQPGFLTFLENGFKVGTYSGNTSVPNLQAFDYFYIALR